MTFLGHFLDWKSQFPFEVLFDLGAFEISVKDSPDTSHFIFEINFGKSQKESISQHFKIAQKTEL